MLCRPRRPSARPAVMRVRRRASGRARKRRPLRACRPPSGPATPSAARRWRGGSRRASPASTTRQLNYGALELPMALEGIGTRARGTGPPDPQVRQALAPDHPRLRPRPRAHMFSLHRRGHRAGRGGERPSPSSELFETLSVQRSAVSATLVRPVAPAANRGGSWPADPTGFWARSGQRLRRAHRGRDRVCRGPGCRRGRGSTARPARRPSPRPA